MSTLYGVWLTEPRGQTESELPAQWLTTRDGSVFATSGLGHAIAEGKQYLRHPSKIYAEATAAIFGREGEPFFPPLGDPPPATPERR